MTKDEALDILCETAFDWAGEYGFSSPERATKVWAAAQLFRPNLEPQPSEYDLRRMNAGKS